MLQVMYASFFGLNQAPFSIAPDPRYLFMSERHREALAHLLYGVGGGGGFVLLTGEIGAGKTTVCRCFLEQIPADCHVAYIFNPKLTVAELLQSICEEFRIPEPDSQAANWGLKEHVDRLNQYLLSSHAQGQHNVLIIDEAQNLSADVLEQLRLLTNLETNERKLLQIILIGQPELRDMLARPDMEQLAQRVIARYHLDALTEAETAQYVHHRLKVAGLQRGKLFDTDSLRRVHRWTRGVPRRINVLCDRALLGAYAENKSQVNANIVDKAAAEVFPHVAKQRMAAATNQKHNAHKRSNVALASVIVLGLAGVAGALWLNHQQSSRQPAPQAQANTVATTAQPPTPTNSSASALTPASHLPNTGPVPNDLPQHPSVSVEEVLAAATDNENTALRLLMTLWDVPAMPGDVCANAWRRQLMCHQGNGGLNQIRQLNRPVTLRLRGTHAQRFAVLTHLESERAHLRLGDKTVTLPLSALPAIWRGDFVTVWRTPPGYQAKLQIGQSNPTVGWVASQLARADGRVLPKNATSVFDAALEAKVQAFQLTQGLTPDGVVGATTLMLLNKAVGIAEPRLLTPSATPRSAASAHVVHP